MVKRCVKWIGFSVAMMGIFLTGISWGSLLTLEQQNPYSNIGDTFYVDIIADIDTTDPIMGFGFDLSFDGGSSFAAPGDSGSALTFVSFTPNSALGFVYDSLSDLDGDGINGLLDMSVFPLLPGVSGNDVHLGTFEFTAFALGQEILFLGADYVGGLCTTEGLIPDFTASNLNSAMPNTPSLKLTPVPIPEPLMLTLFGLGLLAVAGRNIQ